MRTLGDAGCHCMYLNASVEKSLFRSPTRSNECRPHMRGNPVGGRRQFYRALPGADVGSVMVGVRHEHELLCNVKDRADIS